MRSDEQLEMELEKLSVAERVTLADVEANILKEDYIVHGGVLTICILTLQNGFMATGESACASPENFNKEMGEEIAKSRAISKVWEVMGYALRQKLHDQTKGTLYTRMIDEYQQVKTRAEKLTGFINTEDYLKLHGVDKQLLVQQKNVMVEYCEILADRLERVKAV